ncbi:ATP-binding cassette domain-containing protein [Spiroplasma endosymbiont of Lonchoptera lutea]|uniref:ATP-binding cassette domain-containing protein n=2 Tax=unclassified Spiroplasma TaxID=2637901 RepID=UPI0030D003DE
MLVKVFIDSHHLFILNSIWLKILLGFIIIILMKMIVSFCQQKIILMLTHNFITSMTHRYYFAISESNFIIMEQYQDSDWLQRVEDLTIVCSLLTTKLLQGIHIFVMAIISTILLFFIHWWFLLAIGLQSLILLCINLLFHNFCYHQQIKQKQETIFHYQQYLQLIQSATQRIGCDVNDVVLFKIQQSYDELQKTSISLSNAEVKVNHYEQLIISLCNLLILYLASNLLASNMISLGQIIFASSLTGYVTNFFQEIGQLIITRKKLKQAINRVKPLLFFKKEIKHNSLCETTISTISLQNVSFKYCDQIIFQKINYQFKKTNFISEVSGSGKSTLLKLIGGMYDNYQGIILLNNQDMRFLAHNEIICYLQQHPYVYEGTVLDNIVNFNYQLVNLAKLEKLNVSVLLQAINLNINTKCDNNGSNLSSGQRQVVAFLSLFFHHQWKIILIDESLSNVNQQLKIKLIKLLLTYFDDALIIFVSHDSNLKTYFSQEVIVSSFGVITSETNNS